MTLRRDRRRQKKKSPNPSNFGRPLCPNNCGEPGPHYAPPGFGSGGFFICTPLIEEASHE